MPKGGPKLDEQSASPSEEPSVSETGRPTLTSFSSFEEPSQYPAAIPTHSPPPLSDKSGKPIADESGIILGFLLWDADHDVRLGYPRVNDGAVLCQPFVKVNIEAQTNVVSCGGSDDYVTPVHVELSGPVSSARTERVIPYMVFGDLPKDPNMRGRKLITWSYILSAVPDINLAGGELIRFQVVDCIKD